MKRLIACFALLTALAWPLAADAGAKGPATAATVNLVGVDLLAPAGLVQSPFIGSSASITGVETAPPFVSNLVVSYVKFWVDLPASQILSPQPYGGCSTSPGTCQFMGRDDQAPYSLGYRYDGPSGRHTATVQVWRDVWGDAQPVLLGQASSEFCLNNCSK